jgi:hypothetical protein
MDIAIFTVGAAIGLGAGLVCRRNNMLLIPTYYRFDAGSLGKK